MTLNVFYFEVRERKQCGWLFRLRWAFVPQLWPDAGSDAAEWGRRRRSGVPEADTDTGIYLALIHLYFVCDSSEFTTCSRCLTWFHSWRKNLWFSTCFSRWDEVEFSRGSSSLLQNAQIVERERRSLKEFLHCFPAKLHLLPKREESGVEESPGCCRSDLFIHSSNIQTNCSHSQQRSPVSRNKSF